MTDAEKIKILWDHLNQLVNRWMIFDHDADPPAGDEVILWLGIYRERTKYLLEKTGSDS
jgi:hypothetical protein